MTTQSYDLPLGTTTLGASRTKYNDAINAVRAMHEGPSAPSTTTPYMLWVDTTNSQIKQRNAADDGWIIMFELGTKWGGLIHPDESGQAMTVDLSMGSQKLTNLGAPSAGTDAARKQELDLKAPIASPVFTGQATIGNDPTGGTSLTRRSWIEANYVNLAGSTMTGRLGVPSSPTAAASEALRRDEIEDLVTFDTSTGHNHNGTNSRKVNVPLFKSVAHQQLFSQTLGSSMGSYTTVDITSYVTPDVAELAVLDIDIRLSSGGANPSRADADILLRAVGDTNEGVKVGARFALIGSGLIGWEHYVHHSIIVPVDSSDQFEYKILINSLTGANNPTIVGTLRAYYTPRGD